MKQPTKFLLICFTLAALSFAGTQFYLWRFDIRLANAVTECEAIAATEKEHGASLTCAPSKLVRHSQRIAEMAGVTSEEFVDLPESSQNDLIVKTLSSDVRFIGLPDDGKARVLNAAAVKPAQKRVVDMYTDKYWIKWNHDDKLPYKVAIPIIALGVLPHLWYFLLRRLSEIVAVIRRQ